jgi:hypothetical protein
MTTKFKIHVHMRPTEPFAFTKVRVYNCFHTDGFAFYDKLPKCAKDVASEG